MKNKFKPTFFSPSWGPLAQNQPFLLPLTFNSCKRGCRDCKKLKFVHKIPLYVNCMRKKTELVLLNWNKSYSDRRKTTFFCSNAIMTTCEH